MLPQRGLDCKMLRLHYYRDEIGNFGDDFNAHLGKLLFGPLLNSRSPSLLVGVGTLLNRGLPDARSYVIYGSGAGYGDAPVVDEKWTVICVRGPRTAKALGLTPESAVTDPGLLIRRMVRVRPDSERKGVAFIPHHHSALLGNWRRISRACGVTYIDPSWSPLVVARQVAQAKLVITEAMHGAIFADALRTPFIPVTTSSHILGSKWQDWMDTVGLDYAPVSLPTIRDQWSLKAVSRLALSVRMSLRTRTLRRYHYPHKELERTPVSNEHQAIAGLLQLRNSPHEALLSGHQRSEQLEAELMERSRLLRATVVAGRR